LISAPSKPGAISETDTVRLSKTKVAGIDQGYRGHQLTLADFVSSKWISGQRFTSRAGPDELNITSRSMCSQSITTS
jgi:hypothetical protein